MKYYEYTFQCGKLPTKHTLHSLVSHFLGKENLNNINYKVFQEGRIIRIISDVSKEPNFSVNFFNKKGKEFECFLHSKKERETQNYKKGTEILLSGTIEYGVNITGQKGKKCPIFLGRFESNELRNNFKTNIERQFGVKVESMKNTYFNRMPSEILDKHIQFNNIINISIPVIVENEDLFEKIAFSSYFQKKSYGYGNIVAIE